MSKYRHDDLASTMTIDEYIMIHAQIARLSLFQLTLMEEHRHNENDLWHFYNRKESATIVGTRAFLDPAYTTED